MPDQIMPMDISGTFTMITDTLTTRMLERNHAAGILIVQLRRALPPMKMAEVLPKILPPATCVTSTSVAYVNCWPA
ncbi:hypothetical protein C5Y96_17245 [Blastopirellula marina]|uniref:Uncharacterized protein n=1 Tax=Blastopirellula marina TaxID=124 RepID=A0A2S8F590_9BACT|nr:hypothetical protein C5Y96_17245 [Blastopirellula marina]RCS47827.1 hypothetical protein DTL36_17270 [Bremerella cremea]